MPNSCVPKLGMQSSRRARIVAAQYAARKPPPEAETNTIRAADVDASRGALSQLSTATLIGTGHVSDLALSIGTCLSQSLQPVSISSVLGSFRTSCQKNS